MTKKLVAACAILLAFVSKPNAQGLLVGVSGGLQGVRYGLPKGSTQLLPGGSFDLLYAFPLKGPWELISGISGGIYRTQASLPNGYAFTDYQVDDAGSAFQYSMTTVGYKETQQFFAAGVPVLIQYQRPGAGLQWYVNAGGRALFPSNLSIHQSAQALSLSGYYPDYRLEVRNLPQHGFGTINNWKGSESAKLKPAALLSAAAGLSFPLAPGFRLYAGLYVDYGLTPLNSGGDSSAFVTYSPSGVSKTQVNSVSKMPGAGRMTALSYGLQIRLDIGPGKPKSAGPLVTTTPSLPEQSQPVHPDISVAAPPEPTTAQAAPPAAPTGTTMTDQEAALMEKPVLFGAVGETSLSDYARNHLDQVAEIMQRYPSVRIAITGHICNSSTGTESVKIGEARARTVANYLRAKGVQKNRMDVKFTHDSDPVTPNNPGANYQKRRAVISMK